MIKLGITKEYGLSNAKDLFNRNKEISIPLITSLINNKQYSENVYPYFNMIRIGKTFKRTKKDRFGDLDDLIVEAISTNFHKNQMIVIHDLASSNGTTSCHLYDKLQEKGLKFNFNSSDKFTHIYMVRLKCSGWTVVMDTDKNFMQYVGYGLVLGHDESKIDIVNRAIVTVLDRFVFPKARGFLCEHVSNDDDFSPFIIDNAHGRIERFPLVSPECLYKMEHTNNFVFSRRDLFLSITSKTDVVRALNILNRDYFIDNLLRSAVLNILSSLNENGLFIVGRSHDSEDKEHNVTIFRKSEHKFTTLLDYLDGTEIKDLILSVAETETM